MQRKRFFRWCRGLLLIAALGPSAASGKDPDTDAAVQLGERFIDAFLFLANRELAGVNG